MRRLSGSALFTNASDHAICRCNFPGGPVTIRHWKIVVPAPSYAFLAGVVTAILVLWAPGSFAGEVYDGDSVEIEGQPVRLYGIDAFELRQTCLDARGRPWRCGVAAKAALAERIEGQALRCVVLDEDQDGWYISRCVGEDGTDIAAYMVRSGLALADTEDYLAEEAEARRRRAGAWEGAFMPPWQWRAQGR